MTSNSFGQYSLRISDYEIPIQVVPDSVLPADALCIIPKLTPDMVYLANIRLPNTTSRMFICSVNPVMGSKAVLVRRTKKPSTNDMAPEHGTR